MSAHTVAGLLQSQTPVSGQGDVEKVYTGGSLQATLSTTTLRGQKLSEQHCWEREPYVLWYEKKTQFHTLYIIKTIKRWGGSGGTDKLKMDSVLGSLSITRVYGLSARNKHFLITDST